MDIVIHTLTPPPLCKRPLSPGLNRPPPRSDDGDRGLVPILPVPNDLERDVTGHGVSVLGLSVQPRPS